MLGTAPECSLGIDGHAIQYGSLSSKSHAIFYLFNFLHVQKFMTNSSKDGNDISQKEKEIDTCSIRNCAPEGNALALTSRMGE